MHARSLRKLACSWCSAADKGLYETTNLVATLGSIYSFSLPVMMMHIIRASMLFLTAWQLCDAGCLVV